MWVVQVKRGPCTCSYPTHCDSQGGGLPPTRMSLAQRTDSSHHEDSEDGVAGKGEPIVQQQALDSSESDGREEASGGIEVLEQEHVHKVYDAIALHFSATRSAPDCCAARVLLSFMQKHHEHCALMYAMGPGLRYGPKCVSS